MTLGEAFRPLSDLFARGFGRFERHDEREFLPAALEVLETPASPAGRVLAYTIVLFFLIALTWAFIGKVDVIATAPGRVLPAGKVKVVQPLDTGVVKAIYVQDGDHVTAGQLLIELDPTNAGADRDSLSHDLVQADLDVARLNALRRLGESGGGGGVLAAPKGASAAQSAEARAALRAQADQHAAKIAGFDQQISQKTAEIAEVAATIEKLNASVAILTEKVRLRQELKNKGFGTTFSLLDAQQALSESHHELSVQAQRAEEARAGRSSLERQRDEAKSQYASNVLGDLSKVQEKRSELTQELLKAQTKSTQTQLRAPIDGVIEQLVVHTVGGVVTPAQHLLMVVPDSQHLVVEAQLANRDVGFVRAGQSVAIKVETFNFTRYGLLHGTVGSVSRDVVAQDGRDPSDSGAASDRPLGVPTYVARIALGATSMVVNGVREPLQPGMSVTAEIRTGSRSIIDYLFSPIARRSSESLHER